MRRWSRLRSRVESFFAEGLDLQLHLEIYRMQSRRGRTDLPRYRLQLGDETIWDYPRDFVAPDRAPVAPARRPLRADGDETAPPPSAYPHQTAVSAISALLREYTDAPRPGLLDRTFPTDRWGLTDILEAADRRLGRRRLLERYRDGPPAVRKVLAARFPRAEGPGTGAKPSRHSDEGAR